MFMSKGRLSSRWIGLAIIVVAACLGSAAYAGLGQPSPWEMKLQDSASPVMDNIVWFHNFLLWLITGITLFVLALLVIVVVRFNAKSNPVPSRTTHNTLIEVAWTIIPVLILVGIAVPSFRLLFQQLDVPKADLTIKATGNQWNWDYEYQVEEPLTFNSAMLQENEEARAAIGKTDRAQYPRLLAVDNEVVVSVARQYKADVTDAQGKFIFKGKITRAVQVALGDLPHGSIGYQTIFAAGLTLMLLTLGFNILGHLLRRRFRQAY